MIELYVVIDLVSCNLAGDYDAVDDALAALLAVAKRHGKSAIEQFSLMHIHDDDQYLVAVEDDLVSMVETFGLKTDSAEVNSQAS